MDELESKEQINMDPKLILFQGVVSSIVPYIGRDKLESYEKKALAFVVDELCLGYEGMSKDQFLEEKLGVRVEEKNPRDAAWHIYSRIYDAKKARLSREKEASMSDVERLKSFNAIGGLMESSYNMMQEFYKGGKDINTIGGVIPEWVPQWFSNPQVK